MKKILATLLTLAIMLTSISPIMADTTDQMTTQSTVKFEKDVVYGAYDTTIEFNIIGADEKDTTFSYSSKEFKKTYKWNKFRIKKKSGKAVMTAYVNDEKITCTVMITKPKINKEAVVLKKGKTATIKVSGINKKNSKITCKVANKKVAKVVKNKKGKIKIKAKKNGGTTIEIDADGEVFTVVVAVAKGKTYKAVKYAVSHLGDKYSQSKRMKKGYYDCSSLITRAYSSAGITIKGGSSSGIANAYKGTNKVVYTKGLLKASKLMPGDIITCGSYDNTGKVVNVGHIIMHIGGGWCIEAREGMGVQWCNYGPFAIYNVIRPEK